MFLHPSIIRENHFDANKFSLFFLAYVDEKDIPTKEKGASEDEIRNFALSLKGVIELTQCVAFSRIKVPVGQ